MWATSKHIWGRRSNHFVFIVSCFFGGRFHGSTAQYKPLQFYRHAFVYPYMRHCVSVHAATYQARLPQMHHNNNYCRLLTGQGPHTKCWYSTGSCQGHLRRHCLAIVRFVSCLYLLCVLTSHHVNFANVHTPTHTYTPLLFYNETHVCSCKHGNVQYQI